jgi:hypothetical protein
MLPGTELSVISTEDGPYTPEITQGVIRAVVGLNIRRSVWRTHLKEIIQPLRVVLDAIKPENASGWMFPSTIGGALDLDNLADRVIKPIFKANGLKWKGTGTLVVAV